MQEETDAKLILVTTTYIPEDEAGRFMEDAIRYNDAARVVMEKHSITVRDLYKPSISIHREFGKGSDDVHYSAEGYAKLADVVTQFLEREIAALSDK